jgi:hypothetical protein
MSEFTDDALGRYLNQQPGRRQALLHDPAQHMQVEALRRTLCMVERAMIEEGLPDDVQRRVVNRVVWGEPEGYVDVRARVQEQVLAAYDLPTELTDEWKALHNNAGPVRPGEETT